MTRILPGVLAMAAIVVASNILVQFLILDGLLTWGAFTYPLAFLVTDVMNRIYGAAAALLDISVFNRFRAGVWWKAPLISTLVSSVVDTAIFFSIAFAAVFNGFSTPAAEQIMWAQDAVPFLNTGPLAPLWVSLAVADWGVKVAVALCALVPFRLIVGQRAANHA